MHWIKNEDGTEWRCQHCPLVVDAEKWQQVMLHGTMSFPQCTSACAPHGILTVEVTPESIQRIKARPWTVPPELTDQIANMPPTLGMSPVKIVEIDPNGKTQRG